MKEYIVCVCTIIAYQKNYFTLYKTHFLVNNFEYWLIFFFIFQQILNSMHRFQPRVHLVTRKNPMDNSPITNLENENYHTYIYPETVFTAVTAYQNQLINTDTRSY